MMTLDELISKLKDLTTQVSGNTPVEIEVDDDYYNGSVDDPFVHTYRSGTIVILRPR